MSGELPEELREFIPEALKNAPADGLVAVASLYKEFRDDNDNFDDYSNPQSTRTLVLEKQVQLVCSAYDIKIEALPVFDDFSDLTVLVFRF